MEWSTIIFYGFAAITLISGLFILFTKNILYAAFALMLTFIGVAGIFVFAGAEFVAITQVLVYVGGVLILIVFGVMLTSRLKGEKLVTPVYKRFMGTIVGGGLFLLLIKAIFQANFSAMQWMQSPSDESTEIKKLGMSMMTDYVLVFEVIGVLLLVALIGAVHIAGRKREEVDHAG